MKRIVNALLVLLLCVPFCTYSNDIVSLDGKYMKKEKAIKKCKTLMIRSITCKDFIILRSYKYEEDVKGLKGKKVIHYDSQEGFINPFNEFYFPISETEMVRNGNSSYTLSWKNDVGTAITLKISYIPSTPDRPYLVEFTDVEGNIYIDKSSDEILLSDDLLSREEWDENIYAKEANFNNESPVIFDILDKWKYSNK